MKYLQVNANLSPSPSLPLSHLEEVQGGREGEDLWKGGVTSEGVEVPQMGGVTSEDRRSFVEWVAPWQRKTEHSPTQQL